MMTYIECTTHTHTHTHTHIYIGIGNYHWRGCEAELIFISTISWLCIRTKFLKIKQWQCLWQRTNHGLNKLVLNINQHILYGKWYSYKIQSRDRLSYIHGLNFFLKFLDLIFIFSDEKDLESIVFIGTMIVPNVIFRYFHIKEKLLWFENIEL